MGAKAPLFYLRVVQSKESYNSWLKITTLLLLGEQSVVVVATVDGYWNIHFEEIQKQDEGEYFCVANNELAIPATRTSRSATVRVGGLMFMNFFQAEKAWFV